MEQQLLPFAFSSVLLLVLLRRWIKGRRYGHVGRVQDLSRSVNEFTGQTVVVFEDMVPWRVECRVELKGAG